MLFLLLIAYVFFHCHVSFVFPLFGFSNLLVQYVFIFFVVFSIFSPVVSFIRYNMRSGQDSGVMSLEQG